MAWIPVITDRTLTDVEIAKKEKYDNLRYLKGAYNYIDLNRVENNCRFISDKLRDYGYYVEIITKTNWVVTDIPTLKEMNRVRNNVLALWRGFNEMDLKFPITFNNTFDYIEANNIELNLEYMDKLLDYMIDSFPKANTVYAGEVW